MPILLNPDAFVITWPTASPAAQYSHLTKAISVLASLAVKQPLSPTERDALAFLLQFQQQLLPSEQMAENMAIAS